MKQINLSSYKNAVMDAVRASNLDLSEYEDWLDHTIAAHVKEPVVQFPPLFAYNLILLIQESIKNKGKN